MKREIFDDCIEAVLSEHEKKVVAVHQAPKFTIETITGVEVSGTILAVTPSLVTVKEWLHDSMRTIYIRRELIVMASVSYVTLPDGE